jgi:NADH:ubiquinone oxidoreductase subunit F (NADH-binding)
MTAVMQGEPATSLGWIGEPRLLAAWERVQSRFDRDRLLGYLDAVNLTGRGGAAFPLAAKIRSLRAAARRPIVVVNGTEGEPASFKDRALLTRNPHLVLDGALIAAEAIGAQRVAVAVTDPAIAELLRQVIRARADRARFGVYEVPDRFVSGEARALVRALSGGPAVPPGRRVLPTDVGVDGSPTLLSNAETYGQLAMLARIGPAAYAAVGTPAEPGTTLLTVSGAVTRPSVVEVPFGVTLAQVAESTGATRSQAVVVGGYHGAWLPPDPHLRLSREGMAIAGGTLGAGAVIFVGDQTCGLAELSRVAGWLADQSARQCGPCAFGLPALAADVRALAAGNGAPEVAARHAAMVTGRGACAHPDGAARFVRSGLAVLADEVRMHQAYGGCRRPAHGQLRTGRQA